MGRREAEPAAARPQTDTRREQRIAMDGKDGNSSPPRDTRLATSAERDPLLALRGSGRDLWADEHADDYVRRLRDEWD